MFPRAFDETKSAGIHYEGIRRICNRQIVFVDVVNTLSLQLPGRVTLNGCDREIRDDFIRDNQIKAMPRKIKPGRVLLKVSALRKNFRQDLSLVRYQSRRQIQDVIIDARPVQVRSLFYERPRK